MRLHDLGVELLPDAARVVLRLFLPGEGPVPTRSRTVDIVGRLSTLSADDIHQAVAELTESFGTRHDELTRRLIQHADMVGFEPDEPGSELKVVVGGAFSAEYAVEAAALCNPSAMPHPDQSGLAAGQFRLAIALRCIGEGHTSSIGFASAVIGPGATWRFEPRVTPTVAGETQEGSWTRGQLKDALQKVHRLDELSGAVVRALPKRFRSSAIEAAIGAVPAELSRRSQTQGDLDTIRTMVWSAYESEFPLTSELSQRVLLPARADESHGMEDARFTRFTGDDGGVEYRATYTAYDGHSIAPRLLVSNDLRTFAMHRLVGPAAINKGMALFPRAIDGVQWALTRTDGETISVATSTDGRYWEPAGIVHRPTRLWEAVQTGNCGSPLETERGWLVITHGVGPLRRYSLGAILLDLHDPRRVIATTESPLLRPDGPLQEGYVPNVVYSCGGILHDGTLWLPYGVGDQSVRAATIGLQELLDGMTAVPTSL